MENIISLTVAMLEKAELLTKEEAEKIDKELRSSVLPSSYTGARQLINELYDRLEVKGLTSRVDFTSIEGKILNTKDELLAELSPKKAKVDTPKQ